MHTMGEARCGKFSLVEGVYLVTGAACGAIYDTRSGNVYAVNEHGCQILTGAALGDEFWKHLVEIGLAALSNEVANENDALPVRETAVEFMWFEIISEVCNERCLHCYAESMPRVDHQVARQSTRETRRLAFREWLSLLEQGHSLGCQAIQFIGGEPFLFRGENNESVLDLARFARKVGYEDIEIFTNATLLTPQKVQTMQELGIKAAVSFYSNDSNIHDAITQTPGSYERTVAGLRLLQSAEVQTRVEIIIMHLNELTLETTVQFIADMGFDSHAPDIIRPTGRGMDSLLQPSPEIVVDYGLATQPNFVADKETVARNRLVHSCLAGKLAITDTGDVLPCIFSRDQILGNVTTTDLHEIAASPSLQSVWANTKDAVLVCQDCEYRYVCLDCRPLSSAVAGNGGDYLTAPYPRCTYNPYIGEWGNGVWRLSENGQPYYDLTLASFIQARTDRG